MKQASYAQAMGQRLMKGGGWIKARKGVYWW